MWGSACTIFTSLNLWGHSWCFISYLPAYWSLDCLLNSILSCSRCYFVLIQPISWKFKLMCDRPTDGRTDRWTDGWTQPLILRRSKKKDALLKPDFDILPIIGKTKLKNNSKLLLSAFICNVPQLSSSFSFATMLKNVKRVKIHFFKTLLKLKIKQKHVVLIYFVFLNYQS